MKGWHGQSPEHSLAARGIKIKLKANLVNDKLDYLLPYKNRKTEYLVAVKDGEVIERTSSKKSTTGNIPLSFYDNADIIFHNHPRKRPTLAGTLLIDGLPSGPDIVAAAQYAKYRKSVFDDNMSKYFYIVSPFSVIRYRIKDLDLLIDTAPDYVSDAIHIPFMPKIDNSEEKELLTRSSKWFAEMEAKAHNEAYDSFDKKTVDSVDEFLSFKKLFYDKLADRFKDHGIILEQVENFKEDIIPEFEKAQSIKGKQLPLARLDIDKHVDSIRLGE